MSMSDNGGGAASNTLGIQMLRTIAQQISAMTAAIQVAFPTFQAAAPATATSPGAPGQVAYDSTHFYVCVAANTWVRATLATF